MVSLRAAKNNFGVNLMYEQYVNLFDLLGGSITASNFYHTLPYHIKQAAGYSADSIRSFHDLAFFAASMSDSKTEIR